MAKPSLAKKYPDLSKGSIEKLLSRFPEIYLDINIFNNADTQMKIDGKHIGIIDENIDDISTIPDASETVLWYAINENPNVIKKIHDYKNFNYNMYQAAVGADPTLIKFGEPDDELLAFAAYMNPVILSYYDEISEEVMEYIIGERQDAYQYIKKSFGLYNRITEA